MGYKTVCLREDTPLDNLDTISPAAQGLSSFPRNSLTIA